jgi:quercetin dioxygenase-like cupin family protein
MDRPRIALIFTCALVMGLGLSSVGLLGAQQKREYMPQAETKKLVETALHGVPGKKVTIMHFKLAPGYVGGKHYHTGPVFVYVANGALTIDEAGKPRKTIPAGEVYVEPIGEPMQGRNLSGTAATELVVFQVHGEGEPLMIKVD